MIFSSPVARRLRSPRTAARANARFVPVPVHVTIHDVSPAWKAEVEAALDMAHAHGIRPALLVVPNFHGQWPLDEDAAYCARLRELQADGHEIYLHGFYHRAPARPDGGSRLKWIFRQKVVSAGEAEFAAVTRSEAEERLDDGRKVLEDAGLHPTGFIAPAWSMPSWLLPKLGARGYGFAEDHLRIYDPAGNKKRASVVLNWASRSPGRVASTVAWCRIAKHARAVLPARIAIHPGDMRVLLLKREIESMLAWAEGDVVERGAELFS